MLINNLQPCITELLRIIDACRLSSVDTTFINTLDNPISGNVLENHSYDHVPNFIIFESKSFRNKITKIKTRHIKNVSQQMFSDELYDSILKLVLAKGCNANSAGADLGKKLRDLYAGLTQ